jgi:hypothetical protein
VDLGRFDAVSGSKVTKVYVLIPSKRQGILHGSSVYGVPIDVGLLVASLRPVVTE